MKKLSLFLSLIASSILFSQVKTLFDQKTKKLNNYQKVEQYYDGTPMTKSKVDGKIFIMEDGLFYRRVNFNTVTPQDFGAKGNAIYKNKGDLIALNSGDDDTQAIQDFFSSRKKTPNTGSHLGGSSLYFPYSTYKTYGSYKIDDSYTKVFGDGNGVSVIHFLEKNNKDVPAITFGRNDNQDAWNSLLTGGGLSHIQINSDNSSIRNNALLLDYVEYMNFEDLHIRGFGKSAIKGSFWESNFNNLTITACGSLQVSDKDGVPITGVIDTDSGTNHKFRDASNNTLFTKLTFSSCGGTLLKLTSFKNTTVNFNINGIYAETYPGDLGKSDELPLVYMNQARNCSITNGFFTINPTETVRNGTVINMDEVSHLSLSHLNINLNPSKGYLQRQNRRLSTIANIGQTSVLDLSQVTISDPSDSVGFGIDSVPPLFIGNGQIKFSILTFQTLDYVKGGTRRVTNLFDRKLRTDGDVFIEYFDENGSIISKKRKLSFNEGKIIYFTDKLLEFPETWTVNDKIILTDNKSKISEKICTEAGTTGTLINVNGSIEKGNKVLNLDNSSSHLLIGDWITIEGVDGYHRIANISGKKITLEQASSKTVKNANILFKKPVWKEIICK